ncbi:hypothetical protein I6F30_25510 [Bradyrhizobium sp. NBAIM20]|uniref:hypothetical protein n=1 Tax=unclassified Bradyrhizobium TaxID=2631580 RepID=UPI001CD273A8|nr:MULTISPECIES: hypothetical protein [unclassified Bradyrhizobium]MCA1414483.1 hypothetical protein [Bradyrhizobium sp. NBAIM20]MCA1459855.1 hypothetical protein [Bradyrhizobium sp. NBAIM18]
MLKEVEQMPLVQVSIDVSSKTPILIQDKTDHHYWRHLTVEGFLSLNVEQAKAEGGTAKALIGARKKAPRPRIPQTEVDRAADRFLAGDNDE